MELRSTQITRSLAGILATLTLFTVSQSGFLHECWIYIFIDGAFFFPSFLVKICWFYWHLVVLKFWLNFSFFGEWHIVMRFIKQDHYNYIWPKSIPFLYKIKVRTVPISHNKPEAFISLKYFYVVIVTSDMTCMKLLSNSFIYNTQNCWLSNI